MEDAFLNLALEDFVEKKLMKQGVISSNKRMRRGVRKGSMHFLMGFSVISQAQLLG